MCISEYMLIVRTCLSTSRIIWFSSKTSFSPVFSKASTLARMPPKRAGAEGSVAKAKPTKKRRAADTDPPATAPKQKGKTAIADVEDAWHAPSFSADEASTGTQALLAWYDTNHRVLPWRRTPGSKRTEEEREKMGKGFRLDASREEFAYGVWVSEIMLQQTRVATVIPYYEKWLAKWPTVQALAGATQEEVNDAWAGLGYYRRARYLLDGAKYIVDKCGGVFPSTVDDLRKVPGVGPYTASAVGSIAFGIHTAVVDGNVIRVMARLRAIDQDPKKAHVIKAVGSLALQLVDVGRAGCSNQALMELGATVCAPENPACDTCPVRSICSARRQLDAFLAGGGAPTAPDAPLVTRFPLKAEKAKVREETLGVCLLEARPEGRGAEEGRFALLKRPEGGLLAGLWEFPSAALSSEGPSKKEGTDDAVIIVDDDIDAEEEGTGTGAGTEAGPSSTRGKGDAGPSSDAARCAAVNALLRSDPIGVDLDQTTDGLRVTSRKKLGEVKHVFSHVKHQYIVEHAVIELSPDLWRRTVLTHGAMPTEGHASKSESDGPDDLEAPRSASRGLKWLPRAHLLGKDAALTSGVAKCFELLAKREAAVERSKASGILKFFGAQG